MQRDKIVQRATETVVLIGSWRNLEFRFSHTPWSEFRGRATKVRCLITEISQSADLICANRFFLCTAITLLPLLPRLAFESLLARYWRNRARLSNHSVHHRPIVTNQLISFCLRIRMSRADTDSLVLYELNFDARWCIWSIDQTCWGLDKMQSTAPEFESLGERSKIVVFVNM